jgi:hypothetical protein
MGSDVTPNLRRLYARRFDLIRRKYRAREPLDEIDAVRLKAVEYAIELEESDSPAAREQERRMLALGLSPWKPLPR